MQSERLVEMEIACNACAPGTVFVAINNGVITRIDPKDVLELIRFFRTLYWTRAVGDQKKMRASVR